jgi:hypothetical protein
MNCDPFRGLERTMPDQDRRLFYAPLLTDVVEISVPGSYPVGVLRLHRGNLSSHLVSAQLSCRIFRSDAAMSLHFAWHLPRIGVLKIRYHGFFWLDTRVLI